LVECRPVNSTVDFDSLQEDRRITISVLVGIRDIAADFSDECRYGSNDAGLISALKSEN
jgi:hypothetical protein